MDLTTEIVFSVTGESLLRRAFFQILRSWGQSAQLAREVVSHNGFRDVDKRKLLRDPLYFQGFLSGFRSTNGQVAQSVDSILQSPDHIGKIQRFLVEHPFLKPSVQNGNGYKRSNFLILGHKRAGKTVLLYRMLYGMVKNRGISVKGSETEFSEAEDETASHENFRLYLKKLAALNDQIDMGKLPDATIEDRTFPVFLDLAFPKFDWTYRLRLMDYAGSRIESFHSFEELIGEESLDGVLLIIDSQRLLAEDLLESAYKAGILDQAAHEAAFRHKFASRLQDQTQITEETLLHLNYVLRERASLPVSIVLTKFDGFDEYKITPKMAKRLIYKHLGSTLDKLASVGHYPLSICLASSFNRSRLARRPDGSLILNEDSLGVPGHVAEGRFPFHERASLILPLFFLIQMSVLQKIAADRETICRQMQELNWWRRLFDQPRFRNVLEHFDSEAKEWQPWNQEDPQFLTLQPADRDHAIARLRAFFHVD